MPDIYVLYHGKSVYVELKSPIGSLSQVQRAMRLALLVGGAGWWLCRSACLSRAGMVALHRSGVRFRSYQG